MFANNHDLMLMGTTTYMNGKLGVSINSKMDTLITKTDVSLNTKWIVSVDINNTKDMYINAISNENKTFWMILNSNLNSCLFTLNYSNGEFIASKWYKNTITELSSLNASNLNQINMIGLSDDNLVIFFPSTQNWSKLMFCR